MPLDEALRRPAVPEATRPGRVFHRVLGRQLPVVARAEGAEVWDTDGKRYLDAAGGAIVVNVGHGVASIARVIAEQVSRVAYAHGTAFSSEPLEAYAAEVGPLLPLDEPAIYPVSGGSEAVETALKMVRAYHLARGEPERLIVVARWGSYHGNTLGALDLSGRKPLRRPYEPWLGRFRHISAAYPYRAGEPDAQALGTAQEAAEELDLLIRRAGPETVAAFVGEPVVGATLGAVVPPADYWPRMAEVCRSHGVLLVADEVMTGFGRTGRWFGLDHWGVRPDLLVAAKGACSGYWPFGFVAASGHVYDAIRRAGAFTHGFTYSHSVVGAAVARQVLRLLREGDLVAASARQGERLLDGLRRRFAAHPYVGEIRGLGLMAALELVEDGETRAPFPRTVRLTERVLAEGRARGLLLYSGTGNADGVNGDIVMFGPPFIVSDEQLAEMVATTGEALDAAIAEVHGGVAPVS